MHTGLCIDKLGSFTQARYLCVLIHVWIGGGGWRRETGVSPPVKYFADRSSWVHLLVIFYVFSVLCLLCLCVRLFICAWWSPAGKGLTSWLSFVVSNCELSLSHWYPGSGVGFLIFAPLLTFLSNIGGPPSRRSPLPSVKKIMAKKQQQKN